MSADSSVFMKASVLMIILIWSLHVSGLEATQYYGGRKSMQRTRMNSAYILRGLRYDLSKMNQQQYKKRMRNLTDRVSPGGPDHQHNSSPPALDCKDDLQGKFITRRWEGRGGKEREIRGKRILLLVELEAKERSGRWNNDIQKETTRRSKENVMAAHLPDIASHHIVKFLSTRDAIGASILSTQWECGWSFVHALDFDEEEHDPLDKLYHKDFIDFVTEVLRIRYLVDPNLVDPCLKFSFERNVTLKHAFSGPLLVGLLGLSLLLIQYRSQRRVFNYFKSGVCDNDVR
ncbi:unnamed protein product [Malus baccata var. baccata]